MAVRLSVIIALLFVLPGCQTGSSAPKDSYTIEDVPVGLLQLLVNKSRQDVMRLIGQPAAEYEKAGYIIWEYRASTARVIIIQFPRVNPGIVAGVIEGFDRESLLLSIEQQFY